MATYEKYHTSLVDCGKVRPHVEELIHRCGGSTKAAEYALVGHSTLLRIMHNVHCTVQQGTARKILIALEHRRIEDRKNHETHEELLKARQRQIRMEDNQERLIGY